MKAIRKLKNPQSIKMKRELVNRHEKFRENTIFL